MHYKDWQCETETVDLLEKFFSSLDLYDDLHTNGNKLLWYSQIKVKRNERQFWKDSKTQVADIKNMMRHNLTAILRKDNMSTCWQICTKHQQSELSVMSTNMFWNQPMTDSYCHSRWTWKWAKQLFLHILNLQNWTVLSFSLLLFQNHHKNTLDLHWSVTWYKKLKGCPNIWPHKHVRRNTSTNQPKTLKPQ